MSYSVETTARFDREFKKLDRYTQRILKGWIDKNLVGTDDPRRHGKVLTADRSGQWRYRIGDYRLICRIDDGRLIIIAHQNRRSAQLIFDPLKVPLIKVKYK